MLTELLHRQVALLLTQVSMQRLSIIAVFDEFIGYLLRLDLCATEDDGEDTWVEIHNALQCQVFILGIHHIIDMVHILCTLITTAYNNLFVVMEIGLSHSLHLLTHCGREHQSAMFCR